MVGLSHQSAPVAVRERLAFTAPGALERALVHLKDALGERECVLLSTCNRTELYVAQGNNVAAGDDPDASTLAPLLARAHGQSDLPELAGYFTERRGHRAVEHLFRVAAGLESMIVGESDIVRQVKTSYAAASDARAAGPLLSRLFHEALRVAKRARTEYDLGKGAFSVGHAAVDMAQSIFGRLGGRVVLLLGAGKMSETTARHLSAAGASSVLVANRTFDKAARLAETLNGRAIRYEAFAPHLAQADIVIASTAAPHAVVTRDLVEGALKGRRHRPLFLIDIAVPRDIEASVGELDDVFLYNIDDLRAVVDNDEAERRIRATRADVLVHDEALSFAQTLRARETALPLVSSLRARMEATKTAEMARLAQRLPHLSPADLRVIEASFGAVIAKIAHEPTVKIKEYALADNGDEKIATARELFGLSSSGGAAAAEEKTP